MLIQTAELVLLHLDINSSQLLQHEEQRSTEHPQS